MAAWPGRSLLAARPLFAAGPAGRPLFCRGLLGGRYLPQPARPLGPSAPGASAPAPRTAVRRRSLLEPMPRGALRHGDFGFAHLDGDFPAQPRGIRIAAHGGEIEPLMRRHII